MKKMKTENSIRRKELMSYVETLLRLKNHGFKCDSEMQEVLKELHSEMGFGEIINLPRGEGKTEKCISELISNPNSILIAMDDNSKNTIRDRIRETNKNYSLINDRIFTISEIINGKIRETSLIEADIIIDELHYILQCMLQQFGLYGGLKFSTITLKTLDK